MKRHLQLRGAKGVIHQRHQALRLPRKMTLMIDACHIWNVIYNARSNRHHPPTSPNTAPATQNCIPKSKRNLPKTVERHGGRFDHDPTMKLIAKLNPSVRRAYFSPLGNAFCIENYNISRSGYLPRFHRILRLPQKVTPRSPNTAPATKSDTPRSPNAAPATKSDTRRSPNTAPATKNELKLYGAGTLLSWYFNLLNCYFTEDVIYNARSNRTHLPMSPNTAPAS